MQNPNLDALLEKECECEERIYRRQQELRVQGKWDEARAVREEWRSGQTNPFNAGQLAALRAYEDNRERETDLFEIREIPSLTELPDYIGLLREAKVDEVVITAESTALLPTILKLNELNCDYGYTSTVYAAAERHYCKKGTTRQGVSFLL